MSGRIDPRAGEPASTLIDVDALLAAYGQEKPDAGIASQRVAFGTSGHRGSAFDRSFNEAHVLAITQAICDFRKAKGTTGPLFLGIDTHALSGPARDSAIEVLAANGVETMLAEGDEFTPTPAVSHAILVHNRGRASGGGLADGIVVTPSHNPPKDGGFKYNATDGGPAGTDITGPIEKAANAYLEAGLAGVRRMPLAAALAAGTTRRHDFVGTYVDDLADIVDFDVIRGSGVRLGVDPLGGAGVHYWARIAERHRIDLEVTRDVVDPTFSFMTLDWDGQIRMDPSSPYAMRSLLALKDRFDVAFACDTDHDRHGIVAKSSGLLSPNAYLALLIDQLFRSRPHWPAAAGVGKTVVSTTLIDRVADRLGRRLFEAPVGFKWFAPGLYDGSLGFGGEESAGASFLRAHGSVWTTDKDGLVPGLLAAEMTARTGRDPGELHRALVAELGQTYADRVDAPATKAQKKKLAAIDASALAGAELAGEPIDRVLTEAPGNGQPIGGIKAIARSGWFAARPSGTEDIYKIYAESFESDDHLRAVLADAQAVVDRAIAGQEER